MRWPAEAWPLPLADADPIWRLAALEWTAGPAAFRPVMPPSVAPDGVVTVAEWDTAAWDAAIGDPALVGFTLITHEGETLRDADVVLNVGRFAFADVVDPRAFHRPTTLRHELGHVLALGHVDTIGALMHPAQEPGSVTGITGSDATALDAESTCCAARRAPDLTAIDADDRVWAHRADGSSVAIPPTTPLDLPADTARVEIWTTTGHGALFAVEVTPAPEPDVLPPEPAPPVPMADPPSDCRQRPGSNAVGSWILLALLYRRRS